MSRRNRKSRAVKFYTNGKLANDQYGLSDFVGQTIKRIGKVNKMAGASTARKIVSITRAEVVGVFNVKKGVLNKRLYAENTGQTIIVHASQRLIPVMRFGATWEGRTSPGASVQIIRGKTLPIKHAFINKSGSGKYEAVRIRPFGANGKRVPRGGLDMIYGPSVKDMINGNERLLQSLKRIKVVPDRNIGPYAPGIRALRVAAEYHVAEVRRLLEAGVKNG